MSLALDTLKTLFISLVPTVDNAKKTSTREENTKENQSRLSALDKYTLKYVVPFEKNGPNSQDSAKIAIFNIIEFSGRPIGELVYRLSHRGEEDQISFSINGKKSELTLNASERKVLLNKIRKESKISIGV